MCRRCPRHSLYIIFNKIADVIGAALVLRYYPSVRVHIAEKPVCSRPIAISCAAVCTGTRTAPFAVLLSVEENRENGRYEKEKSEVNPFEGIYVYL